jgi:hypothetical protein
MIKIPDIHPYQVTKFEKAVLHINHNPAVLNKHALLPAISSCIDLTNQYPAIHTAPSSFASFNVRKGMQLSLLSTIRNYSLIDLYFKFMFQIYPQYLNTIDTSISSNLFKTLPDGTPTGSPSSGNYHIGLSVTPPHDKVQAVTGNFSFVCKSSHSDINRFFLSY